MIRLQWIITAGIYDHCQVAGCNKLNLYFAQEPINKQLYAFRTFDDEQAMDIFIRGAISTCYDKDGEEFKLLYDKFKATRSINLFSLSINAEPKI